jgi:hypothetical protein
MTNHQRINNTFDSSFSNQRFNHQLPNSQSFSYSQTPMPFSTSTATLCPQNHHNHHQSLNDDYNSSINNYFNSQNQLNFQQNRCNNNNNLIGNNNDNQASYLSPPISPTSAARTRNIMSYLPTNERELALKKKILNGQCNSKHFLRLVQKKLLLDEKCRFQRSKTLDNFHISSQNNNDYYLLNDDYDINDNKLSTNILPPIFEKRETQNLLFNNEILKQQLQQHQQQQQQQQQLQQQFQIKSFQSDNNSSIDNLSNSFQKSITKRNFI